VSDNAYVTDYANQMEDLIRVYLNKYPEDQDGKLIAVDFYIKRKEYDKAFDLLNEYMSKNDVPFSMWMQAALLANAAGKNEALVEVTTKALNIYTDSVDLVFFKALGLYSQKAYKDLINTLENIDFSAYSNAEYEKNSYNLLAEAYHYTGEYTKADSLFEMIIQRDPGDYVAMNNYSYYLAERGENLERARLMSYTTIRNNPENATFLDTYAWILYKSGEYADSGIYIQKALKHGGENDPEINEHAGDIYMALKSPEMAKIFYEKALILGGDTQRLEEKIKKIRGE
jgi:tetratricopeptide (TPR) repeat protein